jgi:hypothetical protein
VIITSTKTAQTTARNTKFALKGAIIAQAAAEEVFSSIIF